MIYDGNDWNGTAIIFIDLQDIVDLYIFANFSNNVALERNIITFARDSLLRCSETASGKDIGRLVDASLDRTGLYNLIVDGWAYHWSSEKSYAEMHPPGDFAMHVLVRKCEIETEKQRDAEERRCCYDVCYYHLHESEEERKASELCNGCVLMVY